MLWNPLLLRKAPACEPCAAGCTQVTTPVAIMTSDAKGNHARMLGLMESLHWFGRGREAFRLFRWGGWASALLG